MLHGATLRAMIASCLIFLAACATPGEGDKTALGAGTQIQKLEVKETGRGTRISLDGSGPLPYQVFPLDNPPRLLLAFANIGLAPSIQPQKTELTTVTGVFPMETPEGGSRVEIMMRGNLSHDISERENGLDVLVQSPEAVIGGKAKLKDVKVTQKESGTTVELVGTGRAVKPQAYRLNSPPRLVVDLFGVEGATDAQYLPVKSAEVSSIQFGSSPDKLRLVLELALPQVTFRIDENPDGLPTIVLGNSTQGAPQLQGVNFGREGDASIVTVQFDRSDVYVDSKREGNDLILTMKGVNVPTRLTRRMDVSAFGGEVKAVDTYGDQGNGLVVVRMTNPGAVFDVVQKGEKFLVKVQSQAAADAAAGKGRDDSQIGQYTGELITMDFKDIDIQNALKLLSEIGGMNIITSNEVSGTLTMRLVDVPWDQALDLILETKELGKLHEGNIIRVAPLAAIKAMADARVQATQSTQQLENLVTEFIPVNFATVEDIKQLLTEGDANEMTRQVSPRGSAAVDKRTNTLIIKDIGSNMPRIRELIRRLDKPVPQVLIEARIVEVSREDSSSFGINWYLQTGKSSGTFALSDDTESAQELANSLMADEGGSEHGPSVNLMGGIQPNVGIHLGSLNPFIDLDVELGAMEAVNKSKIISSPRVLTVNNKAAQIKQGVQIPYTTVSDKGTETAFVDAVLMLEVTPQITPDGFITMEVKATNNSPSGTGDPPPIDTKEVETNVLVKNNETIVLGGIYTDTQSKDNDGIPGLSTIPMFGWLFKNQSTTNFQTELLIFITTRIIEMN